MGHKNWNEYMNVDIKYAKMVFTVQWWFLMRFETSLFCMYDNFRKHLESVNELMFSTSNIAFEIDNIIYAMNELDNCLIYYRYAKNKTSNNSTNCHQINGTFNANFWIFRRIFNCFQLWSRFGKEHIKERPLPMFIL